MYIRINSNIRNDDAVAFHFQLEDHLSEIPQDNDYWVTHKNKLTISGGKMIELHALSHKKSKLNDLNYLCERTWMSIGFTLRGFINISQPDMKKAAHKLFDLWNQYGSASTRKNVNAAIVDYKEFIEKLNQPEMLAYLALFNALEVIIQQLKSQVEEIVAEIELLDTQYQLRADDINTTEAKNRYVKLINTEILFALHYWAMVEPESFAPINSKVRGAVKRANELVKYRSTRAANLEEEENLHAQNPEETEPQEHSRG